MTGINVTQSASISLSMGLSMMLSAGSVSAGVEGTACLSVNVQIVVRYLSKAVGAEDKANAS